MNPIGAFLSETARGNAVSQLVIQYTTYCNASCPQCGMSKDKKIVRRTLDKDYVKRVIEYAVSKWNIQVISFTGGEPFLFADDIIELINFAGSLGVKYIRTGTNGFIFQYDSSDHDKFKRRVTNIIEKLSKSKVYTFWISLDSARPSVHEKMRGFKSLVTGIEKSMAIFEQYGLYPAVNLGLNRNIDGFYNEQEVKHFNRERFYERYRNGISEFYQTAINLGFTIANICYPMSAQEGTYAYHATSKDKVVSFSPKEKAMLFTALYDVVLEYRPKIRIFTPCSSLKTLIDFYNYEVRPQHACRGGIDYFYLDAQNGHIYPCGYRSEDDLGEIWDIDIKGLKRQKPWCTRCEWECFRDPSELTQPAIDMFRNPIVWLSKLLVNENQRLWLTDLLYYYSCDFFNIRKRPNFKLMKLFGNFKFTNSIHKPIQDPCADI